MKTKKLTPILLFLLVVGLGTMWFIQDRYKIEKSHMYTGPVETVRVGTVKEYSTLVLMAQKEGFFLNNGLNVVTTEYDSGASSFKGLLNGEVDITTGSDFISVMNSFNSPSFKIITSMFDSSHVFKLIARRDHGINVPSDLKGKKIGVTTKSTGEFFLGTFLSSNNLLLSDVVQVSGEPKVLSDLIEKGDIDAVITFSPHTYNIIDKLGNNSVSFESQEGQSLYALLLADSKFIDNHSDAITRFISCLSDAEKFIKGNPIELSNYFNEHFHYTDDYIKNILSKFNFRLSLDQALILAMEDESRWAIANKLTEKNQIPNYFNIIYFKSLDQVRSDAVTIIH